MSEHRVSSGVQNAQCRIECEYQLLLLIFCDSLNFSERFTYVTNSTDFVGELRIYGDKVWRARFRLYKTDFESKMDLKYVFAANA